MEAFSVVLRGRRAGREKFLYHSVFRPARKPPAAPAAPPVTALAAEQTIASANMRHAAAKINGRGDGPRPVPSAGQSLPRGRGSRPHAPRRGRAPGTPGA